MFSFRKLRCVLCSNGSLAALVTACLILSVSFSQGRSKSSDDEAQGQDLEQLEADVGLPDGPVLQGLDFKEPDFPDGPVEEPFAKKEPSTKAPTSKQPAEAPEMTADASSEPQQRSGEPGEIFGRIADAETIAFVGDVLVSIIGMDVSGKTDDTGKYRLENVPPGVYTVTYSKQGFVRVRVTEVEVQPGESKKIDMTLQPDYGEVTELDAVTMTISSLDTSEVILLAERKEAYAFQDSIGSDDFARFGVDDAAGALGKVTGVSIQDGKYIVVRGLSDRYNNTMLNGLLVPTPDPDKKAVQLDLFPAKLLENIVVTKTFTPDQPGDFTGGSVNLITKTFPEAFTASASFSLGFNTNATFNDEFLTYDGGIYDIFGVDDGTRAIPEVAEDYNVIPGDSFPVGSAESDYVEAVTDSFNTTMTPRQEAPGPNIAFGGSVADKFEVGERTVGVVASVSYDLENNYYGDGLNQRIDPGTGGILYSYEDRQGTQSVLMGGLLSLGWEFAPENSINFTSIYNRATDSDARIQTGPNSNSSFPAGGTSVNRSLSFIEREIYTFSLVGDHTFVGLNDIKFNWVLSQAHTSQDEPDTRFLNNYVRANGTEFIGANDDNPQRLWRTLSEERPTAKVDLTIPFSDVWKVPGNNILKTGGYYMQSSRTFEETVYQYNRAETSGTNNRVGTSPPNLIGDANTFPNNNDAGFPPTPLNPNTNPYYVIASAPGQGYDGYERIRAGYIMTDFGIFEDVQLLGGVRFEQTIIETSGTVPSNIVSSISNASIRQTDALPAVAMTYAVTDEVNLRFAFSQTIARPTMREIAPYGSVDFLGGDVFLGNPTLQLSNISNYDFRVEWFPDAGEVIAFSFFVKELGGPIERVLYQEPTASASNLFLSPFNANTGTMYGGELELRKSLAFISPELEDFSINANATIIDATVSVGGNFQFSQVPGAFQVNVEDRTRRLQGQPKYIVNLGINYDNIDWGTSISLNYNQTSDILYAAAADTSQFPDVFEAGVPTLDLIIRQAVAENWTVSFSAKNLTNPNFERYYANGTLYSVNDKGRSFSIGASYSFE